MRRGICSSNLRMIWNPNDDGFLPCQGEFWKKNGRKKTIWNFSFEPYRRTRGIFRTDAFGSSAAAFVLNIVLSF